MTLFTRLRSPIETISGLDKASELAGHSVSLMSWSTRSNNRGFRACHLLLTQVRSGDCYRIKRVRVYRDRSQSTGHLAERSLRKDLQGLATRLKETSLLVLQNHMTYDGRSIFQ